MLLSQLGTLTCFSLRQQLKLFQRPILQKHTHTHIRLCFCSCCCCCYFIFQLLALLAAFATCACVPSLDLFRSQQLSCSLLLFCVYYVASLMPLLLLLLLLLKYKRTQLKHLKLKSYIIHFNSNCASSNTRRARKII